MIKRWPLFLVGLLVTTHLFAKTVVIAAVPPNPEVVLPPPGYMSCQTLGATFVNGVWMNQRQVCQYQGPRRKAFWTSGYWQCNHFKHAACKKWVWIPNRLQVYGGVTTASSVSRVVVTPVGVPPARSVVIRPVSPPPPSTTVVIGPSVAGGGSYPAYVAGPPSSNVVRN